MSIPIFAADQKFAMMAIGMVYTDLPDYDLQLSDGTWVLNHVPVEIQKHWIEWIGSIRTDQVRHALQRTRQMESLVTSAYSKILSDVTLTYSFC